MARSRPSGFRNPFKLLAALICAALPAFAAPDGKQPRLKPPAAPLAQAGPNAPAQASPPIDPAVADRRVASAHAGPDAQAPEGVDPITTAAIRPSIPSFFEIEPQPYLGPELPPRGVRVGSIEPVLAARVWTPEDAELAPAPALPAVAAAAPAPRRPEASSEPPKRRASAPSEARAKPAEPAAAKKPAKPAAAAKPARPAAARSRAEPKPARPPAPRKEAAASAKPKAPAALDAARALTAPERLPGAAPTQGRKNALRAPDAPRPGWFGR